MMGRRQFLKVLGAATAVVAAGQIPMDPGLQSAVTTERARVWVDVQANALNRGGVPIEFLQAEVRRLLSASIDDDYINGVRVEGEAAPMGLLQFDTVTHASRGLVRVSAAQDFLIRGT